jgi:hypothetical protein
MKYVYICQLPITEQQKIITKAKTYLRRIGIPKSDITECIQNILDSKISDVINNNGTFCK